MSHTPEVERLRILFRVEPGCLGPKGARYIDGFCSYAQTQSAALGGPFATWQVVARSDKSLPETEFFVGNKKLKQAQAARYLQALSQHLDDIEEAFHSALADWIDAYMRQQQN